LATDGRETDMRGTVPGFRKGGECLVLGFSIIRNDGTEGSDMKSSVSWEFERNRCVQLLKV